MGTGVRIAIVGSGALGGAFGAGFAAAGHDVVFVDVATSLVDALNERGLTIVGGEERTTIEVHATADPASVAPAELVAVFVKAHATGDASAMLTPLLGPDSVLATLQNGLGAGDVLARDHAGTPIVCGVTYHAATMIEPGVVRHTVGPTYVGPRTGSEIGAAQRVAGACADAGWPAEVMSDVAPAIWKKLLLNCTNAVAALTGMNAGAEIAEPHVRRLLREVVAEGIDVATALGHGGLDLDAYMREIDELLTRAGEGRASMLQDFDAGRRTEIDALNAAVVREAERLAVEVPINRALVALVKGWERMHGFGAPDGAPELG